MNRKTLIATLIVLVFLTVETWAMPPTFTARETELTGFENYNEVILTLGKPIFRAGQILQLRNNGQWVVPIDSHFNGREWVYQVVEVKVGK